nr:EFR1 family ferrodoxin [uncultured Dethiosulfovibrio sp.]
MNSLYVYSGTGNTLHIADRIAQELNDCRIINMSTVMGKKVKAEGERVGIIYPVHAFGMPGVVSRFMSNFEVDRSSWVFLVVNSAGMPLGTEAQCQSILGKKGIELKASFALKMPGNYPPLKNPPSGEKLKKILTKGDSKLDKVVESIKNKRQSRPSTLFRWVSERINPRAIKEACKGDRVFYTTDSCNSCGVCQAVCPVENIVLDKSGHPRWLGKCTGCLSCFHWCPTEAIQYNRTSSLRRNRYHHPDVSLDRYLKWCKTKQED